MSGPQRRGATPLRLGPASLARPQTGAGQLLSRRQLPDFRPQRRVLQPPVVRRVRWLRVIPEQSDQGPGGAVHLLLPHFWPPRL